MPRKRTQKRKQRRRRTQKQRGGLAADLYFSDVKEAISKPDFVPDTQFTYYLNLGHFQEFEPDHPNNAYFSNGFTFNIQNTDNNILRMKDPIIRPHYVSSDF